MKPRKYKVLKKYVNLDTGWELEIGKIIELKGERNGKYYYSPEPSGYPKLIREEVENNSEFFEEYMKGTFNYYI